MATEMIRPVEKSVKGLATSDGAGVKLTRIIAGPELNMLDPFLLLDEFKNDDPAHYSAGFPDHPHRGFETLTYMLAGDFEHRDSRGNHGHLTAGSVQWMTAGKGVIHSEMPLQKEGLSWGFQLWLNLPAKLKMTEPRYQDIGPERIPVVKREGLEVKVISGTFEGTAGPGQSHLPMTYLDVKLAPGAAWTQPSPLDHNAFIYPFEGSVQVGTAGKEKTMVRGNLAVLGTGTEARAVGGARGGRFLYVAGQPIGEPVARGGPFVMNTPAEIQQAFMDFRMGRLG